MGIRKHSLSSFKNEEMMIYDAEGNIIANVVVLKLFDFEQTKLAKANIALFTASPDLLDMVESYLDRMVQLGETQTIPFLAAKKVYEDAALTEYKF